MSPYTGSVPTLAQLLVSPVAVSAHAVSTVNTTKSGLHEEWVMTCTDHDEYHCMRIVKTGQINLISDGLIGICRHCYSSHDCVDHHTQSGWYVYGICKLLYDSTAMVLAWLLARGHVTVTLNLGNLLYEVQGVREKAGTVP